MSSLTEWFPIAKTAELSQDGHSKAFFIRDPDTSRIICEGFIVHYHGQYYAYVNRCPHLPLPLDFGDGEFFDESRQWIVCRNHGAVFEPASGRCVEGPCYGAHLERLALRVTGDTLEVMLPPPKELE